MTPARGLPWTDADRALVADRVGIQFVGTWSGRANPG
jgi:hypothetical protein